MSKSKEAPPHGVICYWQWKEPGTGKKSHRDRLWELVEAYPIDMDGYPKTQPKHTTGRCHRQEWHEWTNKPPDKEDEHDDWEPILGRAVTGWSIESGVWLVDFHPPEWTKWLSTSFYDLLKKQHNWASMIEGGHDLYLGTARAVEKIIYGEG